MGQDEGYDSRAELLKVLMGKVAEDPYPSTTMLDLIEEIVTPDDVPAYAELLMDKIRQDRFPSLALMNRCRQLAG